jgi:hypothetical protein
MPEHYDLTLLDPDNKLGRDIAIMRAEIEELHAKLARMPALIAPHGTRDHLFDGDNYHLARVVVPGTLMEPWAPVVSAIAVGLISGLLMLSAGIIVRLLLRLFPPCAKASVLMLSRTGEERITIAPRTRDAT